MRDWHHHHLGPDQIVFCRYPDDECEVDEMELCDGRLRDEPTRTWGPCRYHIAHGDYLLDVGEQLALVTHLELVPEPNIE
jgi:hypothetical protein